MIHCEINSAEQQVVKQKSGGKILVKNALMMSFAIGHVTLVAITGTTILVNHLQSSHLLKMEHLKKNSMVPDLQMGCSDVTRLRR